MSSPAAAELARRWRWTLAASLALLALGALAVWACGDAGPSRHFSGLWWVAEKREALERLSDWGLWPLYTLFGALLAAGWRRPAWRDWGLAYLIAQLAGSLVLVRAIKMAVARARPDATAGSMPDTWLGLAWDADFHSFPSGHSADAFTGAVLLCLLLPRPWMRGYALGYAALIGFTRVLLAKHWPSDVLAGAAIGTAAALATVRLWLYPRLSGSMGSLIRND